MSSRPSVFRTLPDPRRTHCGHWLLAIARGRSFARFRGRNMAKIPDRPTSVHSMSGIDCCVKTGIARRKRVEGSRFDSWTRRRFGLATGSAAAAGVLGLLGAAGTEAKKNNNNKKKKK